MTRPNDDKKWQTFLAKAASNAAVPFAVGVGIGTSGTAYQKMEDLFSGNTPLSDSASVIPGWLVLSMAGGTALTQYLMNTFLFGTAVVDLTNQFGPNKAALSLNDAQEIASFEMDKKAKAKFLSMRNEYRELQQFYVALTQMLEASAGFSKQDCFNLKLHLEALRIGGETKANLFFSNINTLVTDYNKKPRPPEFLGRLRDLKDQVNLANSSVDINKQTLRKEIATLAKREIQELKLDLTRGQTDRYIDNRIKEQERLLSPINENDLYEIDRFQLSPVNADKFITQREESRSLYIIYKLLFGRLTDLQQGKVGKGEGMRTIRGVIYYLNKGICYLNKNIYDGQSALLAALEANRLLIQSGQKANDALTLENFISALLGERFDCDNFDINTLIAKLDQLNSVPDAVNKLIDDAKRNHDSNAATVQERTVDLAKNEANRLKIARMDREMFVEYRIREQEKISRKVVHGFYERLMRAISIPFGITGAGANGAIAFNGLKMMLVALGLTPQGILAFIAFFLTCAVASSLAFTARKLAKGLGKLGRMLDKGKGVGRKEIKRKKLLGLTGVLTAGVCLVSAAIAFVGTIALGGSPVLGIILAVATFLGAGSIYSQNAWRRIDQAKRKFRLARSAMKSKKTFGAKIKALFSTLLDLSNNGPWQKAGKITSGVLGLVMLITSAIIGVIVALSIIPASFFCPPLLVAGLLGACCAIMGSGIAVPNLFELFSKAGTWLDVHHIGPLEALGFAIDKAIKFTLPFAAGYGAVLGLTALMGLASFAFPPGVAPAIVIIGFMLTIAVISIGMPALTKKIEPHLPKFLVKNFNFRSVGVAIERGFTKLFGLQKDKPPTSNSYGAITGMIGSSHKAPNSSENSFSAANRASYDPMFSPVTVSSVRDPLLHVIPSERSASPR